MDTIANLHRILKISYKKKETRLKNFRRVSN
ncbi:hypothetical protein MCETHM1_03462 [Flavobacteriaceae bacterium]